MGHLCRDVATPPLPRCYLMTWNCGYAWMRSVFNSKPDCEFSCLFRQGLRWMMCMSSLILSFISLLAWSMICTLLKSMWWPGCSCRCLWQADVSPLSCTFNKKHLFKPHCFINSINNQNAYIKTWIKYAKRNQFIKWF